LLLLPGLTACPSEETRMQMGSGPRGGTFEVVAAELATAINAGAVNGDVRVVPSGGSVDNLLRVQSGELELGLVFAGDAFLGARGTLRYDLPPTSQVRALTSLYGATAQLVVLRRSSIRTVQELAGRRVAIGGTGTGSALAAMRYLQSIGLWDEIIPIHVGYQLAIADLQAESIDAAWLQVGVPSAYLNEIAQATPIRLLDLGEAGTNGAFFASYPFYSPVTVPAGTYDGQAQAVRSFEDAALLVAGAGVNEAFAHEALRALFSERGLQRLRNAQPVLRDLAPERGLNGVTIPLHPGARRFWAKIPQGRR
jgi:hypothetical protein